MKQQILKQLKSLEHKEDIKILYAVESGSRGWGFESKDSDWDVRFLYIHRPEWYLSIDDKLDYMDDKISNDLDFSGWELRKALKLFRGSNPPLLEWLQSPIIYLEQFSAIRKMRKLSTEYFSPKSCMYHYLHMAVGNYRDYLRGEKVKAKRYFYVLRPVLACQWIECKDTMPPMEFVKLLNTQTKDKNLKKVIKNLLKRKINGEELDYIPKIQVINNFLDERIAYFENYIKQYKSYTKLDISKLNKLFRDTLKEAWA